MVADDPEMLMKVKQQFIVYIDDFVFINDFQLIPMNFAEHIVQLNSI